MQAMLKGLTSPVAQTLRRKLTRSLAQRGVLRTAQRCVCKPWEALRSAGRGLLPKERRFRAEEREFDRRHCVETCAHRDFGWMARITSPNWIYGIGYAPVPAEDMRAILAELNVDFRQFVFVDLGAGKGRAVLVASEFPFKRIVGVEYSPALVDALKSNIASYQNSQRRCFEVCGILMDAAQYALPPDPLVLFFHHPFQEAIFRQVVDRIHCSLVERPRKILVIYYDPQCRAVFDQSASFELWREGASSGKSAASGDWVIYESRCGREPAEEGLK